MHVFIADDLTTESGRLDAAESHHASRVLRLMTGDAVLLLDGKGHRAEALLEHVNPKETRFRITALHHHTPRSKRLHLAIAPTKMNDRMEWMTEKAVELGVESVHLLICHHSERTRVNLERYDKVIRAAAKQSMQPWFPVVHGPTDFEAFVHVHPPGFIAHCHPKARVPFSSQQNAASEFTVMIGPEGDFSEAELAAAEQSGWTGISLGESRLRTETAALYACSLVRQFNEA